MVYFIKHLYLFSYEVCCLQLFKKMIVAEDYCAAFAGRRDETSGFTVKTLSTDNDNSLATTKKTDKLSSSRAMSSRFDDLVTSALM